jgi:hypothetical protein
MEAICCSKTPGLSESSTLHSYSGEILKLNKNRGISVLHRNRSSHVFNHLKHLLYDDAWFDIKTRTQKFRAHM